MWLFKAQPALLRRRITIASAVVATISCRLWLPPAAVAFAFQTLAVTPERNGLRAADLIQVHFGKVHIVPPLVAVRGSEPPQVIVDAARGARENVARRQRPAKYVNSSSGFAPQFRGCALP
jgi:H+/gluconate symporter-like permease